MPVRIAVIGTAAFALVVFAASVSRPLGGVAGSACLLALARWRPALLLALALNGFFVYIAAADLSGQSRSTAAYYALLGGALLMVAWRGRHLLVARLTTRNWFVRAWLVAAAVLALWFVGNGALYRVGGHEATVILGEFAAVTIPSVLVVLTLRRSDLRELLVGLVVLGCAFAVGDMIALVHGSALVDGRFTPLSGVDPITAGLVPAFAVAGLLGLDPGRGRRRLVYGLVLTVLIAAAVIPGSRGPVAIVAFAILFAVACNWRRRLAVTCAAAIVGGVVAWGIGSSAGSTAYLTQGTGDATPARHASEPGPSGASATYSTIRIRRYWIRTALAAVPDKPLLGHGLISLRDESPEAHAMGVNGELVYPHNDAVEAIYSLGVIGFVLFLLVLVAPVFLLRRRGAAFSASILFVGAFAESNFSGEIGADALLWAAAALLVVAHADRHRQEVQTEIAARGG